ncbi:hypothetical protein C7S14_5950 [Burkholderia cepacia]|nr:hypothetical protein C7S14_5950 [Burkholderia cepacia]
MQGALEPCRFAPGARGGDPPKGLPAGQKIPGRPGVFPGSRSVYRVSAPGPIPARREWNRRRTASTMTGISPAAPQDPP